jgi:glycosyltransferase involved in cell wall biosynthesis
MDRAALNAQAFARTAFAARRDGFAPDVVVSHAGWGAGLFAGQVFPRARVIAYCEWWYRSPGDDVAWLDAHGYPHPASPEAALHEQARNAPIALELAAADAAVCPTAFQAAQFPPVFRDRLIVLHDGIDTDRFRPCPDARRDTLGGLVPEGARLVTYATRGMEPHRGFPEFMAAIPAVLAADPAAVAVVAGDNRVCYGGEPLRGTDWKARALAENAIDPRRVRFTGTLAPPAYLRLLQRSDAHVYLTVPFVLSWSMLEAMATGCALVASDTAPVREFAGPDSAALLDHAAPAALAEGILATLSGPSTPRRTAARRTIEERVPATSALADWRALVAG